MENIKNSFVNLSEKSITELILILKEFFFEAMLATGYGSGKKAEKMELIPGTKFTRYESGDLLLFDEWSTGHEEDYSSGWTRIFLSGRLIWEMKYHGEYKNEVISFLKEALHGTYEKKIFYGGRGEEFLREKWDKFIYKNELIGRPNSFAMFKGKEKIFDTENNVLLGWHMYHGGILAD